MHVDRDKPIHSQSVEDNPDSRGDTADGMAVMG